MEWLLVPALIATSLGFLAFGWRVGASELKAKTRLYRAQAAEEDLEDMTAKRDAHKSAHEKARKEWAAEKVRLLEDWAAAEGDLKQARADLAAVTQDAEMKARARDDAAAVLARQREEAHGLLKRAEISVSKTQEAIHDALQYFGG